MLAAPIPQTHEHVHNVWIQQWSCWTKNEQLSLKYKGNFLDQHTVRVKKIPPDVFFPKRLGIFSPNFTRLLFLSMLDYKFLFNYVQLWLSYAILSATTQFPSYAQCPPSAETHVFRCLRKLLTALLALLIVVCGKSSQICCSAIFSSGMVFGFYWSLWNTWSITHHTW